MQERIEEFMIKREITLISPFPDFQTVEALSSNHLILSDYRPLFYDIETTGLSASASYCYLIGCITSEDSKWVLRQWLAEKPDEESDVLKAFSEFAQNFTYTIQYNGNKFDLPYLLARCEKYHLEMSIASLPALDLYIELKPCKKMLKFQHMKQPDLEAFLDVEQRIFADGKICIKCYKDYAKKKEPELLQEVLGHNLEDICGLGRIFEMLAYLQLFDGKYEVTGCSYSKEHDMNSSCISSEYPKMVSSYSDVHESTSFSDSNEYVILYFQLPYPVPAEFSYSGSCNPKDENNISDTIYLTGSENSMKLLVHTKQGKLKMYYPNYKDYAYLPAEDTAIPKSLSTYIDKSLKKPAKPETCYTWFEINERFLENPEQQYKYLQHLLEYFLKHC